MKRHTPLRRGGRLERRTRLRPVSAKRASERTRYRSEAKIFLFLNPISQLWLLANGWRKSAPREYKRGDEWATAEALLYKGAVASTQVHHRNKCRGARLLDQRWWMAVGTGNHQWIEDNKQVARARGWLLPLEADAAGRLPDGTVCQTTDELLS